MCNVYCYIMVRSMICWCLLCTRPTYLAGWFFIVPAHWNNSQQELRHVCPIKHIYSDPPSKQDFALINLVQAQLWYTFLFVYPLIWYQVQCRSDSKADYSVKKMFLYVNLVSNERYITLLFIDVADDVYIRKGSGTNNDAQTFKVCTLTILISNDYWRGT